MYNYNKIIKSLVDYNDGILSIKKGDIGEVDLTTILKLDNKYPVWFNKHKTNNNWFPVFLNNEQFKILK